MENTTQRNANITTSQTTCARSTAALPIVSSQIPKVAPARPRIPARPAGRPRRVACFVLALAGQVLAGQGADAQVFGGPRGGVRFGGEVNFDFQRPHLFSRFAQAPSFAPIIIEHRYSLPVVYGLPAGGCQGGQFSYGQDPRFFPGGGAFGQGYGSAYGYSSPFAPTSPGYGYANGFSGFQRAYCPTCP